MAKFGILHWFYNEKGMWMTIRSTDFDAVQNLAQTISQALGDESRFSYTQFSAGGGSVMIENIQCKPEIGEHFEAVITALLMANDWLPDKYDTHSYKRYS